MAASNCLLSTTCWPSRFVDSHGNYQDEVFLEREDAPLYQHQRDLPRLPVPSLRETIDRFLPTALPLAENEEETRTLQVACKEFLDQAMPLQERLLQRKAELQDTSWLQQWWNEAYLQGREPVVAHGLLDDDPSASTGVRRAASALRAAALYRQQVCFAALPQESAVGRDPNGEHRTPLCSVAFKYLFHSCRIPQPGQDCYRIYDPSVFNHAVVVCRNQFFSVPLFDTDGQHGHVVLPLSVMEHNMLECQTRAQQTPSSLLELGWLTTWSSRDEWAHARMELLRIGGPTMQRALQVLESAMLLVCLDEEEPVSYRQRAEQCRHGGIKSGGNRWYDKSAQLVVSRNGKLSAIFEHSMIDGMLSVGLFDHIQSHTYQKQLDPEKDLAVTARARGVANIFEETFSNLSDKGGSELETFVSEAQMGFLQFVDDHEIQVQNFQGYGSNFIKKVGYSPDAYVQMVIQLATYRLFGGCQAGTYEATQTRSFLHGRTEVTRSVSLESKAFVNAMGLEPVENEPAIKNRERKLALLRKATESHALFTKQAAKGHGVDRHFLGLSLLLEPGEDIPTLFSHPLYARSKRWRVSTSTLPTHPGFGPVESDGVGIGYHIKPNSCFFTVTSRSENAFVDRLCHLLEEALVEIQSLILEHATALRCNL